MSTKFPSRRMGEGDCRLNPKCCYDAHDLECSNKFYPPLLGTSTEFCAEVLAKGLPIPKCALARPKKLVIEREPPPLAKPITSRHLKNWQRWCYIWRQTYNNLTAKRNTENRPPVMSSGEVHLLKNEDKELFNRTLHTRHLNGFYIKNINYPAYIYQQPCGTNKEMTEVITKRHLRDFPEMKRQRQPNFVRNEISIPQRKASTRSQKPTTAKRLHGFDWEEQWAKSKHVQQMKEALSCDFDFYGKPDPTPDNLIFKPITSKDGPSETIYAKKLHKEGDATVPQLVFTQDIEVVDETGGVDTVPNDEKKTSTSYYGDERGPILRLRSQFSEIVLKFSKATAEIPHFIKNPSAPAMLDEYFYEDNQLFSITTKCKDVRFIELTNEGTTAIRYQWFRNPPNRDAQTMLQDPTDCKNLQLGETLERNTSQENVFETDSSDPHLMVQKKAHLEFHFSELPGVILPGQSLEFPIIFRSKKPGYFHETLYLLTHPRLNSLDGKHYAVFLSGICTEFEMKEERNDYEVQTLQRFLNERISKEESIDLMDSILDRALSDVTTSSSCSLPYGRVTAESIFYAHNKSFYYYCGKSEKALELVQQLIELLVPKLRAEHLCQCHMSIQCLYNLVINAREPDDLYWSHLRTSECEDLLEELNECMLTISEQRIFSWPTTERRKYVACYSNLVVTFDEILLGMDRLYNFCNSPMMKHIDLKQAEARSSEFSHTDEEDKEVDEIEEGDIGETELLDLSISPNQTAEEQQEYINEMANILEDDKLHPEDDYVPNENDYKRQSFGGTEDEIDGIMLKAKPKTKLTALSLNDTMLKSVKDERHQLLSEMRIKLFEDMLCDGIERMLSTVDSFNNMLDYRSSDAVVVINDIMLN